MKIRNLYLLLAGTLLVAITSCSKTPSNPNTGNVTGNTNPTGKDVPPGYGDGATFFNGGKSALFNIYAPGKTSMYLLGDFNNWTVNAASKMYNSTDGTRWWIEIDNLDPSAEYAYEYLINGNLKVADPYSNKILDSVYDSGIPSSVYPNIKAYPAGKGKGQGSPGASNFIDGIVSDIQYSAPAYTWKTTSFTPAKPTNMVVYEVLPRDFVATHSYQTLTDTLSYMANLGVNAIELMPVNEFEGNDSWGYNSNYMFALDKYYGTPNAYKAFIDACHAKGIAVIQDIVLEDQFGSSPMVQMYWTGTQPAANSPWFDQTNMHPDAVGFQVNHSTAASQYWAENVMKYWMTEYKIDGFRFDEAKGYTQVNSGSDESAWAAYDASRVSLWEKYNNYMKSINPNFYVILEMFSATQEQAIYAQQGMFCWNDLSGSGEQTTMGYATNPSWDISGLFYNDQGMASPGLISYFESHDEERLQFKNEAYGNSNSAGTYAVKTLATGLERDEAGAVIMLSVPGPNLVWQFGERGYDISINDASTGGRLGDKPPHWEYMQDPNRHHLYQVYSRMIRMKLKNTAFTSTTFTYNLTGAVKFMQLLDPAGANNVEAVANFDVVADQVAISFPSTGTWYDNFSGTSITVTSLPYNMTLQPGEYHLFSNTPLKY